MRHINGDGAQGLIVSGGLDVASGSALEAKLAECCATGDGKIVLDLSEARFIDFSGLRAVLNSLRHAREQKREVVLTPVPDRVQRVFELTGVIGILPFID